MTTTTQRPGRPKIHTEPQQAINVELPAQLVQRVDKWAERLGCSRRSLVLAALREFLSRPHRGGGTTPSRDDGR